MRQAGWDAARQDFGAAVPGQGQRLECGTQGLPHTGVSGDGPGQVEKSEPQVRHRP